MVVVCPVCRDVVHSSSGFIVSHGVSHHGIFHVCAGSRSPVCSTVDCCGI